MTGALFLDELSSIELPSASEQLVTVVSIGRVLMSETMLSGSDFRYTNCAQSSESLSSSDDSFDSATGCRSLTWRGMPLPRTDCGLIISGNILHSKLVHTLSAWES